MSDKDSIDDSREWFDRCYTAEKDNRTNALNDLKFARLGEQWDAKVRQQREREGRPVLTINRLPAFLRQVTNDARQNRPAVKVRPVDSFSDVKTANIYTGLIRGIEQFSNADTAYDTAIDFAASCGFGYFRIKTDYACDDSFDLDLMIERVHNPFTVYGCPYSNAADASDWQRAFVVTDLSHEAFKARYKGAELANWESAGAGTMQHWVTDTTVRIAEEWVRSRVKKRIVKLSSGVVIDAEQYKKNKELFDAEGLSVEGERETNSYKVTQRIMSGVETLEDQSDWAGVYIPICPVYGEEINIDGKRHFRSLIRDAIDPQKMFNYWRTMATELVALAPKAPYVGPVGAFKTDPRWETANMQTHPYLEYDGPQRPERQPFAGVPAGALQEAMNASDDMKSVMGLFDASLGAKSNETSGVAINARQREGDVSTFHFVDNLNRAIRYGARVLVDLLPKVYTGERILRVLGEDGKVDMVSVNNGVIDLSRGKYDLVVNAGPSYTTKREEFANTMIEFSRANPATFPLVADKVVVAMDFPDAETIANRFKTMLPPQIQQMESQQGSQEPEKMIPVLMQQLAQAKEQMQQMQQQMQEQAPERAKIQVEGQRAQDAKEQSKIEAQLAFEKLKADIQAKEAELLLKEKHLSLEAEKVTLEREKFIAEQFNAQRAVDNEQKNAELSAAGGLVSDGNEETGEPAMTLAQYMKAVQDQNAVHQQAMMQVLGGVAQGLAALSTPKRIVRGADGRPSHLEPMTEMVQ